MSLDVTAARRHFPFLRSSSPPIYLDSAAMAQVPQAVLNAMDDWQRHQRANVHRGMHARADASTAAYENARAAVQRFINAEFADEIVFVKSCTEAINIVARTWGDQHCSDDDAVVLSILEHHSNIVPWMQLKERRGADVLWIDMDDAASLRYEDLERHLDTGRVKLVSITAQSNVLGCVPDLRRIIEMVHARGALVLVDAAQAIAHGPLDVRVLDCDFLAFSGHKLYGPTGIGVLYAKREHLSSMPPFLGGGMMIREVHREGFTPADAPAKFEAGTPPIAEAIGLAAAITWLTQFSWSDMQSHEGELLSSAIRHLQSIDGLRILGTSNGMRATTHDICGCLSFTINGIHPHDLTAMLGDRSIALRAGHHCCMPLHKRLGIHASTRLSVGMYNTEEEIQECAKAIIEAQRTLHP